MILIGTMNWTSTTEKGEFSCPVCESRQPYRRKSVRPFLTLYFIPVLPLGGLQEYVSCGKCKQSFETSLLSNSLNQPAGANIAPSAQAAQASAGSFEMDLLRSIALIMVDDGNVTENEIRIARRLFENMTESNLTREQLGRACAEVQALRLSTTSFLSVCSSRLDHNQKMLIAQAMFGVAGADGVITPTRLASLTNAQQLLGLQPADFQMAVNSASQWIT